MQQRHNGAEAPHATHDEVAPGTGSRLISGSGVTRPIRLRWLRQRVALSRVGGRSPSSPHLLSNKEQATTSAG